MPADDLDALFAECEALREQLRREPQRARHLPRTKLPDVSEALQSPHLDAEPAGSSLAATKEENVAAASAASNPVAISLHGEVLDVATAPSARSGEAATNSEPLRAGSDGRAVEDGGYRGQVEPNKAEAWAFERHTYEAIFSREQTALFSRPVNCSQGTEGEDDKRSNPLQPAEHVPTLADLMRRAKAAAAEVKRVSEAGAAASEEAKRASGAGIRRRLVEARTSAESKANDRLAAGIAAAEAAIATKCTYLESTETQMKHRQRNKYWLNRRRDRQALKQAMGRSPVFTDDAEDGPVREIDARRLARKKKTLETWMERQRMQLQQAKQDALTLGNKLSPFHEAAGEKLPSEEIAYDALAMRSHGTRLASEYHRSEPRGSFATRRRFHSAATTRVERKNDSPASCSRACPTSQARSVTHARSAKLRSAIQEESVPTATLVPFRAILSSSSRIKSEEEDAVKRPTTCSHAHAASVCPASRFLRPHETCAQIALVSYPRSGNSLFRSLIELITGVITGSDTPPHFTLSQQLAEHGLRGEGITDDRVWMVKSHWPERRGVRPVVVQAAIVLVRSPFDAIDSYFNLVLTETHGTSITEAEYLRLADQWDAHVKRESLIWAAFHREWLKCKVPTLVIRFEDLLGDAREETLHLVTDFLFARVADCNEAKAAAQAMRSRVEAAVRHARPNNGGVYAARSATVGGSLRHFSSDQRSTVLEATGSEMSLFKYETDPTSMELGKPLAGAPHAIYFSSTLQECQGENKLDEEHILLNVGFCLRPQEDARGWRWRLKVQALRDGSLLYAPDSKLVRTVTNTSTATSVTT